MQAYQQRVVEESAELFEKVLKLGKFIQSAAFFTVEPDEQVRLSKQHGFMVAYLAILDERIKNFS